MSKSTEQYMSDVEQRLARLATADPFDLDADRSTLAIAVEGLKLIRLGRREPEAARLAAGVLAVIEERQRDREDDGMDDEPESGLVAPGYSSTAKRDLAAMEHALAVLAEDLHMEQPCSCMDDHACEPCMIIERLQGGLAQAAEFLAYPEGLES